MAYPLLYPLFYTNIFKKYANAALTFQLLFKNRYALNYFISRTFLIDFYVSISVRPTEHYRQTVLACYDYCWPLHFGSHPSATCVIHMSSVIQHALSWGRFPSKCSYGWLSQKDSFRSHMTAPKPVIVITGSFLFFLPRKRRPMELMTSQHGRTSRSQTDLYRCYHCYKCWLKTCSSNGLQTVHTPLRESTPVARSSLYVLFKENICLYLDSLCCKPSHRNTVTLPAQHPPPNSTAFLLLVVYMYTLYCLV